MRLYDAVNLVLKRLDDYPSVSSEQLWTRAEIELYVKDGYDAFCRATKCILDFFYPENLPLAGNYVGRWERNYFDSGMVAIGLINYSGGYWERDYAEASAIGPANSTQPWESQATTYSTTRVIQWEDTGATYGESVDTATGDCTLTGVADIVQGVGLTATASPNGDFWYAVSFVAPPSGGYLVTFYYRDTAVATSAPLQASVAPVLVVSSGVVYGYVNSVLIHTYSQTPQDTMWVSGESGDWVTYPPSLTSTMDYVSAIGTTFAVSMHPIPEDNVTVDRATHDFGELEAEWTRWVEENDRDFQTTTGDPTRFLMDRDGMSRLRIVPAGDGGATSVTVTGTYGLLRDAGDTDGFGTWSPIGSWGVLREIPEHFPMGAPFGIPRRLYSDTNNTRVEYYRLGNLTDDQVELPDRFAKYVEFYAQAKALEREGPGQDIKLSQHFMGRYEDGVRRMTMRLSENKRAKVGSIGSAGKQPTSPALARLPFRYGRGRATRRGY